MGEFTRPKMKVLPDSAIVPAGNILDSSPDHFSHKVVSAQPYYFRKPGKSMLPSGQFTEGDQVLVLSHSGNSDYCRVADRNGLSVFTAFATLEPI